MIGCSWSGGKDSCYALMLAIQQGRQVTALVNMMNEHGKISRSHGLPLSVLQQQAEAIGVPVLAIPTSWDEYRSHFTNALQQIRSQYGVEAMVFGDIDLQPHRDWEEMVCRDAGLEAILPLWQQDRRMLVDQMISSGIEAMIVSCNAQMGPAYLGRTIDADLVNELEQAGIDACGENGEYHTVVINCPLFRSPVQLPEYEKTEHAGYWFLNWKV